jgi:hypothetical protein
MSATSAVIHMHTCWLTAVQHAMLWQWDLPVQPGKVICQHKLSDYNMLSHVCVLTQHEAW